MWFCNDGEVWSAWKRYCQYFRRSWLGPTVFCGKFCEIPQCSLPNSSTHHGKLSRSSRLAAASHLTVNCTDSRPVVEGYTAQISCYKIWFSICRRKAVMQVKVIDANETVQLFLSHYQSADKIQNKKCTKWNVSLVLLNNLQWNLKSLIIITD